MTQDSNLARIDQPRGGQLATRKVDMSDVQILTKREGLVAPRKRINPVATISLGYKTEKGYPQPTRKGDARYIHVHDAEPRQLIQALDRRSHKSLTISLAGDTWPEFVQQRYALYSQTALQVYGDDDALAFIHWQYKTDAEGKPVQAVDSETKQPRTNEDGSPVFVKEPLHVSIKKSEEPERYAKAREAVDVHSSIYFYLAEWEGNQTDGYSPRIVFDGEGGMYRIRSSSQHTIDNLTAAIEEVRRHTGGPLCGVPLELTVDFPEVADPWGRKREIPVFSFRFRPPFRYTAQVLRPMLEAGLQEGSSLALPAPRAETLEAELGGDAYEGDSIEAEAREIPVEARPVEVAATDEDIQRLEGGGRCDPKKYEARYFAAVRGTPLEGDAQRAELVERYTKGQMDSLARLLSFSTIEDADRFIGWVLDQLPDQEPDHEPERAKMPADEYERTYGKSYADQEPARFGAGATEALKIPEGAAVTLTPESETQGWRAGRRTRREADGSLVDEESGEILEPAPTVELAPDPPQDAATGEQLADEAEEMGEGGWAESMGLVTPPPAAPPAADAPSLPLFGDAPGIGPRTDDPTPDPNTSAAADNRSPDELFPDPAEHRLPTGRDEMQVQSETLGPEQRDSFLPEEKDERPALTTAAEIWEEATRLGVAVEPPDASWTDEQLGDYATSLMPRVTAATAGERRRARQQPKR